MTDSLITSVCSSLLSDLISCASVTPDDAGIYDLLQSRLESLGFVVRRKIFSTPDTAPVENFYARIGSSSPHLCFAGHVDVVPAGESSAWRHDPFRPFIEDNILYGRGAVDMKGGIACFISAIERYLSDGFDSGSLSILLTADEEGPAINGTRAALDWLTCDGETFDACLVGEPTCSQSIGDTIKVGRRGSLSGIITQRGVQGHVAYPDLSQNPIPILHSRLSPLLSDSFDSGTDVFQPTNLELTSIDTGNDTFNLIPSSIEARFNVRFNDTWTIESLKCEIMSRLNHSEGSDDSLTIDWLTGSEAFKTADESLISSLTSAIEQHTNSPPVLSTGGGTSDARFIKDVCPVIEFGLVGRTMHQVEECVPLSDLDSLSAIYESFLHLYFSSI